MADGEFRLRVRYGKSDRLRWLSHLEVIHTLERSLRRAELPYAITQGFSPHMKVAFGPALPVGTAGLEEYLDVWLTRYTIAQEALGRLSDATPPGLSPQHAAFVSDRDPSLGAALTIARYEIGVTGREATAPQVQAALDSVIGEQTLAVVHKGKNKVYDLTRCLPEEARVSDSEDGSVIALTVRMGPEGSLRPEVLIRAAFAAASLDASVATTTRMATLVETKEGWARPM